MFSIEPVKFFLKRCSQRLDQELDIQANFWTEAEMLEYLNEGLSEVWQAVRETHQNWFVKELQSTDPITKIGGRDYNPDLLRLTQGRDKLYLPSDFRELLFIEGLPPSTGTVVGDNFYPVVSFEYRNLTQRAFRGEAFTRANGRVLSYFYDVVVSADGPYLLIAPPLSVTEDIRCHIKYIAAPRRLRLNDTFEGTGFTYEMVDALLAYVCYAAVGKEGIEAPVDSGARLERRWNLKRELAVRSAGPKQTRDEETVEGYMEDEI